MGPQDTAEAVDPICGEVFPRGLATFTSRRSGETVYFCSSTCKETFDAGSAPAKEAA